MSGAFSGCPKAGFPIYRPTVGLSAPSGGSFIPFDPIRPNWSMSEDETEFKATLDLGGLMSDLMKRLIEIENEAAEKALIGWLQSRGYEVTRKGEFK